MTRRTKSTAFAGKRQEILIPTLFTTDPGKSHMEITAVEISVNHIHDVCPPETVPGCIHIIPCPFKLFKMIFDTLVITGFFTKTSSCVEGRNAQILLYHIKINESNNSLIFLKKKELSIHLITYSYNFFCLFIVIYRCHQTLHCIYFPAVSLEIRIA